MDQPDLAGFMENINKRLEAIETRFSKTEDTKDAKNDEDSLWDQFAERVSSIVGVKEAIRSENRVIKITWLILLCLGLIATAVILYQANTQYLSDPTATRVQLSYTTLTPRFSRFTFQMKLISDRDYKFPPLLLCPSQWFDVEKAQALGLSGDGLMYSLSYILDLYPLQVVNYSQAQEEFLTVYESHKFQSLQEFYEAIMPDLIFQPGGRGIFGTISESHYTCRGCMADLTTKATFDHNLCYSFQLEPAERGFGSYSGTRSVKIFYRPKTDPIFVPDLQREWSLYFNPIPNFTVSIFPLAHIDAFISSTVKFDESLFNVASTISAPCMVTNSLTEYMFGPCITKCHNQLYRELLGCGFLWLSDASLPPIHHCNTLNKIQLMNRTLAEFHASADNAKVDIAADDICVKNCPTRCNRKIYDTSLRHHQHFSEAEKEELLQWNMTAVEVIVRHGAVYQAGIMELSEVDTYTLVQLISNIGGSLGLFVGATLLTVAQAILFLIDYVFRKRKCRFTARKKQSEKPVCNEV